MAWHAGIGVAAQNLRVLRGQVGDSAADADGLATLEREDRKTPALGGALGGADRFPVTPQRSFEREKLAVRRRPPSRRRSHEQFRIDEFSLDLCRTNARRTKTGGQDPGLPENRSPATGVVAGDLKPKADFAVLNDHRAGRVTTREFRTEPVVSNRR